MRKTTLLLLMASLIAVGVAPSTARAQTDVRRVPVLQLRPTLDYDGIVTLDSASTLGHLRWSLGARFGYANDPLLAQRDDKTVLTYVANQVLADLWLTLGVWHYFEVGLHLPVVVYQDSGTDTDPTGAGVKDLAAATLGDVRLLLKGRFFKKRATGFGMALTAAITAPTGGSLEANGGDRLPTFEPRLVLDYRFGSGTLIALNLGVRIREELIVSNLRVGTELVYGLGLEVPVWSSKTKDAAAGTLSLVAEIFGSVGFADAPGDVDKGLDTEELPLEVLGGLRYRFVKGWRLTLGGGAGLTSGYGSPDFRMFLGVAYASGADRDGDGILDHQDRCPDDPEDGDRFEDLDGCPDPDNDGDGICDPHPAIQKNLGKYRQRCTGRDLAPLEPEDKDGFQDEDGKPEPDNDHDGVCDDDPQIQKNLARYRKVCRGADKCPAEPEDRDKFQDEDGCPDPDNDGDGICDPSPDIQRDLARFARVCRGKDLAPLDAEDRDGHQDGDGKPEPDNDGDGVCDDNPVIQKNLARYAKICRGADKCPTLAEDKDGFEDGDGCPDPDNDKDGFCDAHPAIQRNLAAYAKVCKGIDKCPLKAEVVNGVQDDDGCPDKGKSKIKVTVSRIEILEKVYFRTSRAKIMRKSFALLKQVATVLKNTPWVLQVRVDGHTDERGADAKNLRLSGLRAEAVRRFLMGQGVAANRLGARGYGETRPIRTGCRKMRRRRDRKKCWAENRRVEFTILKSAKGRQSGTTVKTKP
jgi:outer membrane protein OmpA-like peptidoglycan-associated protein